MSDELARIEELLRRVTLPIAQRERFPSEVAFNNGDGGLAFLASDSDARRVVIEAVNAAPTLLASARERDELKATVERAAGIDNPVVMSQSDHAALVALARKGEEAVGLVKEAAGSVARDVGPLRSCGPCLTDEYRMDLLARIDAFLAPPAVKP